uniref:Galectin n=1 Tax=Clavelina picta TaxID=201959 RepID=B3STN4_9ASCI|nr:Gal-16 [Clavelina picta]
MAKMITNYVGKRIECIMVATDMMSTVFSLVSATGDLPFYINFRQRENSIVMNTRVHGKWQYEKSQSSGGMNFYEPFRLVVEVRPSVFKVTVSTMGEEDGITFNLQYSQITIKPVEIVAMHLGYCNLRSELLVTDL